MDAPGFRGPLAFPPAEPLAGNRQSSTDQPKRLSATGASVGPLSINFSFQKVHKVPGAGAIAFLAAPQQQQVQAPVLYKQEPSAVCAPSHGHESASKKDLSSPDVPRFVSSSGGHEAGDSSQKSTDSPGLHHDRHETSSPVCESTISNPYGRQKGPPRPHASEEHGLLNHNGPGQFHPQPPHQQQEQQQQYGVLNPMQVQQQQSQQQQGPPQYSYGNPLSPTHSRSLHLNTSSTAAGGGSSGLNFLLQIPPHSITFATAPGGSGPGGVTSTSAVPYSDPPLGPPLPNLPPLPLPLPPPTQQQQQQVYYSNSNQSIFSTFPAYELVPSANRLQQLQPYSVSPYQPPPQSLQLLPRQLQLQPQPQQMQLQFQPLGTTISFPPAPHQPSAPAPPAAVPVAAGRNNSSSGSIKGGDNSYLNPAVHPNPQPPPLVTPQRVEEHQHLMAATSRVQAMLASLPPSQRQQYLQKMKTVTTSTIPPSAEDISSSGFVNGGVSSGPGPLRGMPLPPMGNMQSFSSISFSGPFSPPFSPRGLLSPRGGLDLGTPGFQVGKMGVPIGQAYPPQGSGFAPNSGAPRVSFSNGVPQVGFGGPPPPPQHIDPFPPGPIMGLKPRSQPGFRGADMLVSNPMGIRGTFSEGGLYPSNMIPLPALHQQQQQRGEIMDPGMGPPGGNFLNGGPNSGMSDAEFEQVRMNVIRLQKQRDHLKAMVGQIEQQQQQGMQQQQQQLQEGDMSSMQNPRLPQGQQYGLTSSGFNQQLQQSPRSSAQQHYNHHQQQQHPTPMQQLQDGTWVAGATGQFMGHSAASPSSFPAGSMNGMSAGYGGNDALQGPGVMNGGLCSSPKGSDVSLLHEAWRNEIDGLLFAEQAPSSAGPVDSTPYSSSSFNLHHLHTQDQQHEQEQQVEHNNGPAVKATPFSAGPAVAEGGVLSSTAAMVVDATAQEVAAVVHELVESAVMASCSSNHGCCSGDEEVTATAGTGDTGAASATAGTQSAAATAAAVGALVVGVHEGHGQGGTLSLELPDIPLPNGIEEVRTARSHTP